MKLVADDLLADIRLIIADRPRAGASTTVAVALLSAPTARREGRGTYIQAGSAKSLPGTSAVTCSSRSGCTAGAYSARMTSSKTRWETIAASRVTSGFDRLSTSRSAVLSSSRQVVFIGSPMRSVRSSPESGTGPTLMLTRSLSRRLRSFARSDSSVS